MYPDLLRQLQGRKVKVADREMVLDTQGLRCEALRRIGARGCCWY